MSLSLDPNESRSRRPLGLAGILFLVGFGMAGLLASFGVHNLDIGFHLAHGEWILQEGAVPRSPVLSDRFADRSWLDDKWLFQVVAALVYRADAWRGLVWLRIALVGSLWLVLWGAGGGRERPVLVTAIGVLGLFAASERFLVRPELFGYPLLALIFWLVDRFLSTAESSGSPSRAIWIAVPLQAIWVNLHTYFLFGLVVLWAAAGGRLLSWWIVRRRDGTEAAGPLLDPVRRTLLGVASAATLASLLNPYHVEGAFFPLWSLYVVMAGGFVETRTFVTEFEPSWAFGEFPASTHAAYFLLAGIALVAMVRSFRRVRLEEGFLLALFFAGSLPLRRNIAIFAVVASMLILLWARRSVDRGERVRGFPGAWIGPGVLLLLLGVLATALTSNRIYEHDRRVRRTGWGPNETVYPVEAVEFVRRHDLRGPLLNDLATGGYLLWQLSPDLEPYIDGNMGAYPLEHLYGYHDLMTGRAALAERLEAEGIELILLSTARADTAHLLARLVIDRTFVLVHLDPVAAVFVRVDGPRGEWARERAIELGGLESLAPVEGIEPPPIDRSLLDWFDPRADPDAEPARRMGDFYFAVGGLPNLAREQFLAALSRQPRDPRLRLRVGQIELDLGDLERGRRWIESALALHPGYAAALHTLGLLRLATGDAIGAEEAFRRAMEGERSRPEFSTGLGDALEASGRYAEARAAYREALEIDPDWGPALLGQGRSLRLEGFLEESRESLEASLTRSRGPNRAALHHELGLVELEAGRLAAARRHLLHAATLAPDDPEILRSLDRISEGSDR